MVSSVIISRYMKGGAPRDGASRFIDGGPIYPPAEVLRLVSAEATVRPVTKECIADVQNLNLNNERMLRVVKEAILKGQYVNAQWCPTGKPGVWAACDAYELRWKGNEDKELEKTLYVKFCIGKRGDIMLLISCHHSNR